MIKRGQIWIETAIYTLIGLVIIGIVLSIATPQIDKIRDQGIIEQTISALNVLDVKILETAQAGPGNIRVIDFKISKGRIEIDAENDFIIYTLDNTRLELSEPGIEVKEANLLLMTEAQGRRFKVTLKLKYDNFNLTNSNNEIIETLQASTTPYRIQIENVGDNKIDEKTHIDIVLL